MGSIMHGILLFSLIAVCVILAACVEDEDAECTSDESCPPGFYCATGGGVFVKAGTCIREDRVAAQASQLRAEKSCDENEDVSASDDDTESPRCD